MSDNRMVCQYMTNFEIYIGNDPNYLLNPRCPGGPFMRTDDPASYTELEADGRGERPAGSYWNEGKEVWCNLEGQYMAIVANFSEVAGTGYETGICSLGVMGTKYVRDSPLTRGFSIRPGDFELIIVNPIRSLHYIGNELDIKIR